MSETVADFLLERLTTWGVRRIFLPSGVSNIQLLV